MENHPIPQDITGFQFKLIGDMTIKQFAYLAGGAFLAYLFFISPLPFFIKIFISFFCAGFGFSLSFVPIDGRPLDTMVSYFLRAMFSPNQYLFQKAGVSLSFPPPPKKSHPKAKTTAPESKEKLERFLSATAKKPAGKLDEKETVFFSSISSLFSPGKNTKQPANDKPRLLTIKEIGNQLPTEQTEPQFEEEKPTNVMEQKTSEELEKETNLIKEALKAAKKQEEEKKDVVSAPGIHEKVLELEAQLQQTLSEKKALEDQMLTLQKQFNLQKQTGFTPTKTVTPNVRTVPKDLSKTVGAPIIAGADFPNLISGIIKDSRNNVLPNILVEVKDKDGNAVRAFKTNALGQFSSATSLSNGTYTVVFEDPKGQHKFDAVEIIAEGVAMLPLEVISTDEREELRRSLFN